MDVVMIKWGDHREFRIVCAFSYVWNSNFVSGICAKKVRVFFINLLVLSYVIAAISPSLPFVTFLFLSPFYYFCFVLYSWKLWQDLNLSNWLYQPFWRILNLVILVPAIL